MRMTKPEESGERGVIDTYGKTMVEAFLDGPDMNDMKETRLGVLRKKAPGERSHSDSMVLNRLSSLLIELVMY
jgi:hypothetical protein